VAESGAMIEYLTDRYGHGRLIPAVGSAERMRYSYSLHDAEGSLKPPLRMKLVFDRVATNPVSSRSVPPPPELLGRCRTPSSLQT
jgi:glutathione S-transferase